MLSTIYKNFDAHKRTIGTVAGIGVAWAWKWQVMPEMWLDLLNSVLTVWGVVAIGDAARKAAKK